MAAESQTTADEVETSLSLPDQNAEGANSPAQTSDATAQPDATASRDDRNPTPAPEVKICGVCKANPPKYKCPRCYLPYCSVACNRTHRENHPPDPEPKPEPKPQAVQEPDAHASAPSNDPRNPFRALDSSDKLKLLFTKYPSLPSQLLDIHAATQPPKDGPEKPSFLPRGGSKKHTWNHDVGIRNGKTALRRARKAEGEDGEAIREYSELILQLLNEGDSQNELNEMLRKQMDDEDTKLIERLMAEEKR